MERRKTNLSLLLNIGTLTQTHITPKLKKKGKETDKKRKEILLQHFNLLQVYQMQQIED
jgi:hypothetical protein